MSKKILAVTALSLGFAPCAFAMSIYFNPTLTYISTKSGTNYTYQALRPTLILGIDNDCINWINDQFYLALEVMASPWKPLTINNNNNGASIYTLNQRQSYGVTLLPGYIFDGNVKGFARIGVIKTQFRSLNATKNGYFGGLGGEYKFNKNWAGRIWYTRTYYSHVDPVGSPVMDDVSLGLVFRFV